MMANKTRIALFNYLVILVFLCLGCKSKVLLSNLRQNEDCIYYQADQPSTKPFTGIAYTTMGENIRVDSNTIANTYNFKNGIPQGQYKISSYGQLIWKGTFTPVFEVKELQNHFSYLKRINISKTEDNPAEIEIYVISANPDRDSANLQTKQKLVINFLLKNRHLKEEEIELIDTIGVWNGEF